MLRFFLPANYFNVMFLCVTLPFSLPTPIMCFACPSTSAVPSWSATVQERLNVCLFWIEPAPTCAACVGKVFVLAGGPDINEHYNMNQVPCFIVCAAIRMRRLFVSAAACVCVCMHVCALEECICMCKHARTHTHMYVHVRIHMHACVYLCTIASAHVRMLVRMCVQILR